MPDRFSKEVRSLIMQRIRSKDTLPELIVRRIAFGLGYRYVLHKKDLPGSPDLTFPRHKKVIFVHGCFWHHHKCQKGRIPKSNVQYWQEKIQRNCARDVRSRRKLRSLGWSSLVIWECQLKRPESVLQRIEKFMRRRD